MKVFISWSGDFSREVAEKLSEWIPGMIQSVDTFFSPDDIGKGENWNNVLSKELNDCNFGIICLTPENVAAPWIHFEAGALAKSMDSRLSSIMLGISPSDIKGPLSRFQNTKFERTDFFKLVQAINNATDKPLGPNALTIVFDAMWNKLEEEIQSIIQKYEGISTPSKAKDDDAIQEILSIVRKMSSSTFSSEEKGLTIENYENPITPRKFLKSSTPDAMLGVRFALEKNIPGRPLFERTKAILNRVLPASVATKAIQVLEDGSTFCYTFSEDKAEKVLDMLSQSPDLNITTKNVLIDY